MRSQSAARRCVRRLSALVILLLAGCEASRGPDQTSPSPAKSSPEVTREPRQLYETLLTTAFDQELPDGYRETGVSRFVYADAGPAGLAGAVEVSLEPPRIQPRR
jgi:hypothetical protein